MHFLSKINGNETSVFIIIFTFIMIIPATAIVLTTTTTNTVYGQQDKPSFNVTDSSNIQSIPPKKVHAGDIDIAYKTFGKGQPLLLIQGLGGTMGVWEPSILRDLSSNHTVTIFDNRGVGNTTAGTKPFSIQQFANDCWFT